MQTPTHNTKTFAVVGIGASAGGLDALTKLLAQLHTDKLQKTSNKTYVIALHMGKDNFLAPLLSLLRRISPLPLSLATHNALLVPNQILIIPPGMNGEIHQGRIQLFSPDDEHIYSPSIDLLFSSIANQYAYNAICIILSGAGTDGQTGAQQIKARSGCVIAQQPETAQFDAMPSAVINANLADHVLPPEEIGLLLGKLKASNQKNQRPQTRVLSRSASTLEKPFDKTTDETDKAELEQLQLLLQQLHEHTGRDFSDYKEETLLRRIHRRMSLLHISSLKDYLSYTHTHPHEFFTLQQQFLISVSSFFRDGESFAVLKQHLTQLLAHKQAGDSIRIWVPGCATGEECYSLAILLTEILAERITEFNVQIIGSDLSDTAIATAKAGIYSQISLREAAPEIILRYIEKQDSQYQVKPQIRALCEFRIEDVFQHQSVQNLDMVSCRNLLIYLKSQLQDKLIKQFYELLAPQGLVFIGQSETIGLLGSTLFMPLDHFHRIYARKKSIAQPIQMVAHTPT
ncbi:CheR family methyltransferase [Cellvibrio sp. NN19]|uniref:CheR family methyltransferase n=1 Tax=Cellvibrio chitinivorans TaxID=3102792 RepID=UPI002B410D1D|nr:CheR family methyltransferase [Cellvibrio sp. NN19]